ncbi:hypothetical protein [endosymbiont GvMRE of Glomus versiforme]|uniref:hypothetical protein n=1 Tax=endosymbiont GvMRE of Glomus versiforme TaxID=2039283 RepID=UPI0011C396E2|nr:hypothetical protein [endosymbiont GvMRE of Glomus versiforme]
MKKENNLSLVREYENWITFYLNYLNPYFSEKNFFLFQKKWQSYWELFQLWKEKKLDNKEISEITNSLLTTKKTFVSLVKKYEKKVNIDKSLVEKELEYLWNEELAKKITTDRQKVQNYLLGQVKKKFSNYPIKEIIFMIDIILARKT